MGISRPLSQLPHKALSRGIRDSGYFVSLSGRIVRSSTILLLTYCVNPQIKILRYGRDYLMPIGSQRDPTYFLPILLTSISHD